uniref:Glutaredoxin-2, mitochondrial n=1 Tax=Scleropages formosus TaxID=113540 RepID=A0A8C9WHA2_SCLFO
MFVKATTLYFTRRLFQRSTANEFDVISNNCVVIFSKTTCPYCKMAKNVFNEIGAKYKVIELDQHRDGRMLQEALAQMTGARTVPRVFVNGNCIGGGSDTKELHNQGKLKIGTMLKI